MKKDTDTSSLPPTFIPPSVIKDHVLSGESYAYYTPIPAGITPHDKSNPSDTTSSTPCVLGVDEAGRGPVLGPMVYGAFYLPLDLHHSLLAEEHSFDDSKVLTPAVRANLMRLLNTEGEKLFENCGYAIKSLSARDISSAMMRPATAVYNLNAQAMDATIEIIRGVVEERGVDIKEVYIDTIGNPASYQAKLERIFPSLKITVAKKADSLYPCVSAASVAAKVTRDVALEVLYEAVLSVQGEAQATPEGWGSGYPSDSKCVGWMRKNMDPVFGWGSECRFSWGTAKEMLEVKGGARVDWPADEDEDGNGMMSEFLLASGPGKSSGQTGLKEWFGQKQTEII